MRIVDWLNIVIQDHDDLRKKRIAIILAWGIFALAVLSFFSLVFYSGHGGLLQESNFADREFVALFWGTILALIFSASFLLLTRTKIPVQILGTILVLGISIILFYSDAPMELVGGRSTTLLLFPIFMSAVLIHSSAALIVSAFALVPFVIIPGNILEVNFYAWGSVMGLAIVIWVACYIMENAIREAREETYRSNAMLGIASHELRTPLGVIIGNLEMLKLQSSAGNANPATEAMEKSAHCLNETITRLLDQAYIQSGKAHLQVSEVDIRELAGRVSGSIRVSAKEKSLEFNVLIRDSVPEKVLIDPLRVEQILANLLENAVKYTTTGSVSLAVDLNETREKKLTFTVADTGIGIPKNRIRSMFKPFVQGQRYDTRLYGGVGLGLSIVHELINLMKGKIIVSSTVGAGSTFLVTIPLEA